RGSGAGSRCRPGPCGSSRRARGAEPAMAEIVIESAAPPIGLGLRRRIGENQVATLLIAALGLILIVIIALPLWTLLSKSFQDTHGGIVVAEVLYCFPHALLVLVTALALSDGRLYEVAAALGTSRRRVFWTITLPGARYGLISAAFIVFTLVITDFGIPKVIGGQFNV